MPHTQLVIEHTVRVSVPDEATAARVGEILARVMVSLSGEPGVEVSADVERYERVCHHQYEDDLGEVES